LSEPPQQRQLGPADPRIDDTLNAERPMQFSFLPPTLIRKAVVRTRLCLDNLQILPLKSG